VKWRNVSEDLSAEAQSMECRMC